jgi:hypothetical protein
MALSADKTHLVNTFTNKPVFITGESAYNLAVQLSSNSDIETYLSDRASRGFNLIWVAVVDNAYHDPQGSQKNALRQDPWSGSADFTNENEAYFSHVDYIVQRAAAHGITVMMGTAFVGAYNACVEADGYCPDIEAATDATMTAYGVYLGNRYKNYPNLIWLIGGDANASSRGSALTSKLNDLATGIKSADSVHLMTVEAVNSAGGEQSSTYWSGYPWLSVNNLYITPIGKNFADVMAQAFSQSSSLFQGNLVPFYVQEDWYEGEHGLTALQLRAEAYWAVLNGAYLGGLFGNNAIWSFGASCCDTMSQTWQSQLSSPGSVGRQYLGKLFRSREHWEMVPDLSHTVVRAGYGSGSMLTAASRTSDGQTIIAYIPNGNATTLTVAMSKITSSSHTTKCWWFNPSSGATTFIGSYANSGTRNFMPPDSSDWVLVIDDAGAKLPTPGSADL